MLDVLSVEGSWTTGYKPSADQPTTVRALPEEWATAAHHVCRLHALMEGLDDG